MVKTLLKNFGLRSAIAIAATVACAGASALPAFTFDPSAVGLAGSAFTADNMIVSDFAVVTATGPATFTETGYLQITSTQLGGTSFTPTGLNTSYGLYVRFTATGTNMTPSGQFTFGNLDSLTYTLEGYNGPGAFSPTSAPASVVTLGSGSLISGTFNGTSSGGVVTSAGANANLTFQIASGSEAFFTSPTPFYGLVQSAFSNTTSQITTTPTGFIVSQGGGSINFAAAPVPEPETYALMLGGLGALGLVAKRRRSRV